MSNKIFEIADMSCTNCATTIEKQLKVEDVIVKINVGTKKMIIKENPRNLADEQIINLVKKAGYMATVNNKVVDENLFIVDNMSCTNCAVTIKKVLDEQGVVAEINVSTKQMIILDNEKNISNDEIIEIVKKAGYDAKLREQTLVSDEVHEEHHGHDHDAMFGNSRKWYQSGNFKIIFSSAAFFIAEAPMLFHQVLHIDFPSMEIIMNPWFQAMLATLTMFLVGTSFFVSAYRAFRVRSTTMDTLVSVGAWSAYIFSWMQMYMYNADPMQHYFFEATIAILSLIYIGHYLEHRASDKTNNVLNELMNLNADVAYVERANGLEKVVPSQIKVGEIVVVKASQVIPLDGIVNNGSAYVNEAMITGEPVAVLKDEHKLVTGGTIVNSGELKIEVRKTINDGTLSTIITSVEKAQFEKPSIQKTADRISEIFVPIIISLAIITTLIWYLVTKDTWQALSTGLAVVVISCPCAFGLATPLSVLIGSSLAAKRGILYKSGATFEQVRKIDAICFDKTGTLTNGTPKVVNTFGDVDQIASLTYSAEKLSEHPLALAITKFFDEKDTEIDNNITIIEEAGRGINVNNGQIFIGSLKFLTEKNVVITKEQQQFIDQSVSIGASIVTVFDSEQLLAMFSIQDEIKREARELIERLQNKGIETYMITGDIEKVALFSASQVGIDSKNVFSEVTPIRKLEIIKQLQSENKKVAFVGDGINDAPALAQSDLGFAIGSGSKIAVSASDVTLVGGNILLIDEALQISKKTLQNIYGNFGWAFSYNIIAIPIAMLGLLSPTLAAAFMAFSDIVVVLNAQTLRFFKRK